MKNIRHINIRNTAIAIVALAGLAVATTACFGNSSKDSASQALDATIEAVSDQPEDAAKSTPTSTVSRVTTEVESATPATAAPAAAEPAPETEAAPATEGFETETAPSTETAPETETAPSTEAPATTTPATASPSIPALALSPTIVFVTFDQDGTNVNTSIVVEEAGLGRNDIVSVEFTYTKFGTERTVTATKASSTTTSSLWLVEGLMLRVGNTIKIHAVDSRGNSDDVTMTVALSTALG
jgi:type IV secretory pathway VirB10-like protein